MMISHSELLTSDIRQAFGKHRRAAAGRILSGILKAWVKSGEITCVRSHGRMTASVLYDMTPEQIEKVKQQTISKAQEH